MHEVSKSRYVITDGDGDDKYCTQVHDNGSMIGPNFTEAESGIIAFALNTVSAGCQLQCVTDEPDEDGNNVFLYEGPTEGVRP